MADMLLCLLLLFYRTEEQEQSVRDQTLIQKYFAVCGHTLEEGNETGWG